MERERKNERESIGKDNAFALYQREYRYNTPRRYRMRNWHYLGYARCEVQPRELMYEF